MTNINEAWLATQAAKEVQGVATYLEFSGYDGTSVVQMIVTPDIVTTDNKLVQPTMFRRQISKTAPRKQWRAVQLLRANPNYPVRNELLGSIVNGFKDEGFVTKNEADLFSYERVSVFASYIKQLSSRGFTLVQSKPLYAEISKQDADSIASLKLPTKLMYRIQQVRLTNGFPDPMFR